MTELPRLAGTSEGAESGSLPVFYLLPFAVILPYSFFVLSILNDSREWELAICLRRKT